MLGLSALLCGALSFCYHWQPDSCAAVTLWPAWVWLAPGLFLAALGWSRRGKRAVGAVALVWLLYLLGFAEEPRSLVRWVVSHAGGDSGLARRPAPTAPDDLPGVLRVVSLNCAGGSEEAAAEVEQYQPDLVLLQETPGRKEVEELARRLFGKEAGVAWGMEASILARGPVRPVSLPRSLSMFLTQAQVRLAPGREDDQGTRRQGDKETEKITLSPSLPVTLSGVEEVEVFSLRLSPPASPPELWSPADWRQQAAARRARREQVREIVRQTEALPSEVPVIVGGDFNAPARDAIFRLLRPRLHDAFAEGGRGWGHTVLNDTPMLRIDQVWVSDHFRAVAVVARRTQRSDHRMVIGDLMVKRDA
jgi:endonuclease/exonuclease/phosphatase (EEP) superfamily protein YafD